MVPWFFELACLDAICVQLSISKSRVKAEASFVHGRREGARVTL